MVMNTKNWEMSQKWGIWEDRVYYTVSLWKQQPDLFPYKLSKYLKIDVVAYIQARNTDLPHVVPFSSPLNKLQW